MFVRIFPLHIWPDRSNGLLINVNAIQCLEDYPGGSGYCENCLKRHLGGKLYMLVTRPCVEILLKPDCVERILLAIEKSEGIL